MDTFLLGFKRKPISNEDYNVGTSNGNAIHKGQGRTPKRRKYDLSYLSLGFTSINTDNVEKPMCLLCSKVLAADSLRPCKLRRHLETIHPEHADKPQEFFQRKLEELPKKKQNFQKIVNVPPNALLASYLVSYRIAKCKEPHPIAETLVLPAAIDMVKTMFGQFYANQLRQIPLDDNTIGQRIDDISEDLCDQLVSQMRTSKFAIQLDETTDVTKDAHLIAYVRYINGNNITEDILFCKPIPDGATSDEIFKIIDRFFNENHIMWDNCVGICTDGAGHKTDFQTLVKMKAPEVLWTHCMLHRAALGSKTMSEELNNVFVNVTKVINYIKNSPLKAKLCDGMPANYTSLLYYCEVRWLSRAKVIQRVLELKEEIAMFLEENNKEDSNMFRDDNFIVKLTYLVDIFEKLSALNKSMQGPEMHLLIQKDKVKAFIKKVQQWKSNLQKNETDMFPRLNLCVKDKIEANKNLFVEHLNNLLLQFSNYFGELDFTKFAWIQNPFIDEEDNEFGLTSIEKEKLTELSCDTTLKHKFETVPLVQFWLNLLPKYNILSSKALKVLLPFATSYLCETGFSALATMKSKYRASLSVEKELRVAISSLTPRFDKLCANRQVHPSH